MGEPALVQDVETLSEMFLSAIESRSASNVPETRYSLILRGFERYNLQRFILTHQNEFEDVLQDLLACLRCNGECKTITSCKGTNPAYKAFSRQGIEYYNGARPYTNIFLCPGPVERKEQIRALWGARNVYREPMAPSRPSKREYID